ncbi:MAG: LON peptidase substrate-binding domain-containing protein [Anaerolineae bacterium]|nr:LON peptidase substrate-binding domain-containing protein [Anaerolineae bacterium]
MLNPNTTLSLFPLDVVLFPGMMLPLHIFEKRYQVMIKQCIDSPDQMFGVVLAKSKEAQKPNVGNIFRDDLYEIGTTARITAVEHLKEGRMNVVTVGQERFIVRDITASKDDFIISHVDPYPVKEDADPKIVELLARTLRPKVEAYINNLASASGEDLSDAILPSEPKALAYLAGTAMQGSLPDKQQILSATSLTALMNTAVATLDKENKILAYMLKAYQNHQKVQRLPFVDYSLN